MLLIPTKSVYILQNNNKTPLLNKYLPVNYALTGYFYFMDILDLVV